MCVLMLRTIEKTSIFDVVGVGYSVDAHGKLHVGTSLHRLTLDHDFS